VCLASLLAAGGLSACRGIGEIGAPGLDDPTRLPAGSGSPSANLPPPMLAPATGGAEIPVQGANGNTVPIDPGRVVAHRLNRVEYNNTIRDLFYGMDMRPADGFPVDNYAEGFDNNAQELRMSNLLFEKYLESADKIVEGVFTNAQARQRLVPGCDLAADPACARRALEAFLPRAYRRPVTEDELAGYMKLLDLARAQGDNGEVGLRLALRAALVSPSFLYRIEPDPPQGTTRTLDGFEIASRLSYFLWSSMPDEELFARSRAQELHKPEVILAQVGRMLGDARSSALVDNLAGQWLYTRQLAEITPDPMMFPAEMFDQPLREAMHAETHLYLREVLFGNGTSLDLLRSNFTFLNKRLADHYGINSAGLGSEMKRVDLDAQGALRRGGLLTQGGWLTLTSHPDSTSPTKRGKWILAELLCQEPPPPPPGADNLEKIPQTGTMRQRLSQHAAQEPCRTCHVVIDPLGFGLENYDAIGRWREQDQGQPIDATGEIAETGARFNNGAEMGYALRGDARFARCMTRKLLTYAVGRGMGMADQPALDVLTERFAASGYKFRALVDTIVTSPLMTTRGGNSEP
jgi:hypothetical protein